MCFAILADWYTWFVFSLLYCAFSSVFGRAHLLPQNLTLSCNLLLSTQVKVNSPEAIESIVEKALSIRCKYYWRCVLKARLPLASRIGKEAWIYRSRSIFSVNQPTNHSTNHSTTQPLNRSIIQSAIFNRLIHCYSIATYLFVEHNWLLPPLVPSSKPIFDSNRHHDRWFER